VYCDVYPEFRMTADRVAPLIGERTKMVLLNTPSNPAGVALSARECGELLELCRSKGVVLVSDEIYDEFAFSEARQQPAADPSLGPRCPSPARFAGAGEDVLLIRGFGKTYGVTGWRLGYAAGPAWLIDEMAKLQQYTFVCPPTPLQAGVIEAFGTDVGPHVEAYQRRRDLVLERLGPRCRIVRPDGAFYIFLELPERHRPDETFVHRCIERELLVIPGSVFSRRDTHIRLSLTAAEPTLERGLAVLDELLA
jgi:aspartate/methionine/tyrosine aminotransferase